MKKKTKIQVKNRIIAFALAISIMIPFSFLFVNAEMSETQYKQSLKAKGFPASYHDKLWKMYSRYPNWEFKPLFTGLDWNDALANESLSAKCTVPISNTCRLYKSHSWGTYNSDGSYTYKVIDGSQSSQTGHINSTPFGVSFYLDPRNFLDDVRSIFQFEDLRYDAASQTVNAIECVLDGTFMDKIVTYTDTNGCTQTMSKRYSQLILEAGKKYNVNPVYLASKILQEVGNNGSGSVSGKVNGYVGCYNFFNIGAYHSSTGQAVINGLEYAKNKEWYTPEESILGGAEFIANKYIASGQNTSYLFKFNVKPSNPKNLYNHQYMSAMNDPAQSASGTYSGYSKRNSLSSRHVFLIPVFNNMPDTTASEITINNVTRDGVMNESNVRVRKSPGVDNSNNPTTGYKLYKGNKVKILGGFRTKNMAPIYRHQLYYPLWYHVSFIAGGKTHWGYVFEDFVDTKANINVALNDTYKLSYTLYPSSNEKPMFTSYDTRIATVDSNGNIRGKSKGRTKVIAHVSSGAFDVVNVTVGDKTDPEQKPTPEPDPDPKPKPDPGPNNITSSKYSITSKYVKGVIGNTSLSTFRNYINERNYIKVFDKNGKQITNGKSKITTGCVVKLYKNNTVVKSLPVIVKGDTNCDGDANMLDGIQMKFHILNKRKLTGYGLQAGNYSMDSSGTIDMMDFIQLKKHILGLE